MQVLDHLYIYIKGKFGKNLQGLKMFFYKFVGTF